MPLNRERVLRAGVELADEVGIDALSMRKLGQQLGVEAMSLYNHVSNKEDLLAGMLDLVIAEIPPPAPAEDWKAALRERTYAAREVMKRHQWAPAVIEMQADPSPIMFAYMDAIIGIFREGGFSTDLTHHAMHVLGSRTMGFTQELFEEMGDEAPEDPAMAELMMQQMIAGYPNLGWMIADVTHDDESILGSGCDDDFEFVFTLDLMIDGLERLRDRESQR